MQPSSHQIILEHFQNSPLCYLAVILVPTQTQLITDVPFQFYLF